MLECSSHRRVASLDNCFWNAKLDRVRSGTSNYCLQLYVRWFCRLFFFFFHLGALYVMDDEVNTDPESSFP
jgi:hypothetical protein